MMYDATIDDHLLDDELQINTLRRRARWLWVAFGLALMVFIVVSLSMMLRSEWFLRGRIDPQLERLGEKFGGQFTYQRIEPVGLTGVALEGVVFSPDARFDLPSPLRVDRLVVYPDLTTLLTGDVEARRIDIHAARIDFWLDGGAEGRGHWIWLEHVMEALELRETPAGDDPPTPTMVDRRFPELVFHNSRVDLTAPGGTLPNAGLRLDDLRLFEHEGRLLVDGTLDVDGLGYALLNGSADKAKRNAGVVIELVDQPNLFEVAPGQQVVKQYLGPDSRLELSGIEVQWPPALVIHDVTLTDTHLSVPGQDAAYIEEITATEIRLDVRDEQARIHIDELSASLRVQWWSSLTSTVPLFLPALDMAIDFAKRRVGARFVLDDPERGGLTLAAALDLDALDIAVELGLDNLDAGPLLSLTPYMGPVDVTRGRVDGSVRVRYPLRQGLMDIDLDVALLGVDASVPWLSNGPLEDIHLAFDVDVQVDLDARQLHVKPGTMTLGTLPFELTADVRDVGEGRHVAFNAKLTGEGLPAAALLPSLPRGFAPALQGYELAGTFALDLAIALDTREPTSLEFQHTLDANDMQVTKHGPEADIPALAKDHFQVAVKAAKVPTVIGPGTRDWIPFDFIPKHLRSALVSAEDNRFYNHDGFDLRAIRNSLVANLEARRIVRGGSTLTQQLAKNLFLGPEKTVARKVQEAFLTWQLETHLSKRRILALYLNMVHWGPGVYGIRQAARHYFRRRPQRLTIREAVFLVAILPNPERFGDQYARGFIQADRQYKMRTVLTNLYRRGVIGPNSFRSNLRRIQKAQISSRPRPRPVAKTTALAENVTAGGQ